MGALGPHLLKEMRVYSLHQYCRFGNYDADTTFLGVFSSKAKALEVVKNIQKGKYPGISKFRESSIKAFPSGYMIYELTIDQPTSLDCLNADPEIKF